MVPFAKICPKLAKAECRSIHLEGDSAKSSLPAGEYGFFESYCTEKDCDCRRVILTVFSQSGTEATISYGFDADDDMLGPFLDPLNRQGVHATELLSLVRDVLLTDREYVARLKRHYAITKDIIAGRLRPEDAQPSPRLTQLTEAFDPSAGLPLRATNSVVEAERIDAPFDIHQTLSDEYGERDEDLAVEYCEKLGDRFANSLEAQPLLESGVGLGWAESMMRYSIDYLGETPPNMSVRDVSEVVFEIFPRKVSVNANQAGEVIAELHAFWSFLQREYQLKNATRILELLGPGAEERLHDELDDPSNFGMAKSFYMAGQQAGFDMTTQAGLNAFMHVYNSRILSNPGPSSRPTLPPEPARRMSIFGDDKPTTMIGTRAERRAAERVKLREEKKRKRQAKRL
ncbi:MAG: hypothetical protein ACKV2Q_22950 [Planctomycetaceae bacterium]